MMMLICWCIVSRLIFIVIIASVFLLDSAKPTRITIIDLRFCFKQTRCCRFLSNFTSHYNLLDRLIIIGMIIETALCT